MVLVSMLWAMVREPRSLQPAPKNKLQWEIRHRSDGNPCQAPEWAVAEANLGQPGMNCILVFAVAIPGNSKVDPMQSCSTSQSSLLQ